MKRILSMIAVLVTVLSFGLVNTLYSKGNTLVVGGEAPDRDKLPHIWWNAGAQDYYMSSLLFTDENQNPGKNDLAASREYDANSNTYKFVLRDGIEFHDGTKLTSEDISWIKRKLKVAEIGSDFDFSKMTKVVAGKKLWNYDALEPHEKKGAI